jgi:predicted CopG family antitoxin
VEGRTVQKKLTITIDKEVYEGLYQVVGRRRISRFIEQLVRPHVLYPDLEAAYADMARSEEREQAALELAEAVVGDVADEAW